MCTMDPSQNRTKNLGEPCCVAENCKTGVCLAQGSYSYCSQLCNGSNCPGGYRCTTISADKRVCSQGTGYTACQGSLCIELYRSFYSKEPCTGDPKQSCVYANVFFTLKNDKVNVLDLAKEHPKMTINEW